MPELAQTVNLLKPQYTNRNPSDRAFWQDSRWPFPKNDNPLDSESNFPLLGNALTSDENLFLLDNHGNWL